MGGVSGLREPFAQARNKLAAEAMERGRDRNVAPIRHGEPPAQWQTAGADGFGRKLPKEQKWQGQAPAPRRPAERELRQEATEATNGSLGGQEALR